MKKMFYISLLHDALLTRLNAFCSSKFLTTEIQIYLFTLSKIIKGILPNNVETWVFLYALSNIALNPFPPYRPLLSFKFTYLLQYSFDL